MAEPMDTPLPAPIASQAEKALWRELRTLQSDLKVMERTVQVAALADERFGEQLKRIIADVNRVEAAVEEQERAMTEEFQKHVTLERYKPTELIVFSIVALFGAAIVTAIAALIFRSASSIPHP